MPVNDGDRRAAEGFWSVHGPTRMGAVPALAELLAAHREQAERYTIEKVVAWLRQFGNHPSGGEQNCPRCIAALDLESGAWREGEA